MKKDILEKNGEIRSVNIKEIKDILSAKRESIVIEEDKEENVGPEGDFSNYYHWTEIKSLTDLMELEIIPKGIDEEKIVQAIEEDDEKSLNVMHNYLQTHYVPIRNYEGGKSNEHILSRDKYFEEARMAYRAIREMNNIRLSQQIGGLSGTKIEPNSTLLNGIRHWVDKINKKQIVNWRLLLADDITIGHNSTMNVSHFTDEILARNIRMHKNSKMVIKSPFITMRCTSITGDIP